ncbi:coniferyl aldehyde dehydrogenase [Pseudochrobactrum sp. MP213Fo]|uniref:coniferyl aldehyde dehydrogenase n=1 Tax=Pseudochrobactrum sp. MP213Fo TaxID=3022250 RepID=UPI003BA3D7E4
MTEQLTSTFNALRTAWQQNRPDQHQRRADLKRLRAAFKKSLPEMAEAISRDFGHRSLHESMLAEAMIVLKEIDLCLSNLKRWIKPQRRKAGWQFWPAKAEIRFVPLGVIGILSPWNYPVNLSLAPLVTAIAAGNHVYLKPSEHTPHTNAYLTRLLAEVFPDSRVSIAQGGADIAAAFSALPFDHLFFTGSGNVAKKVMAAAAQNLTPVTLELGGKSPALIAPDADIIQATSRILTGKFFNAGQTCIAPDYVLLPDNLFESFITEAKTQITKRYSQMDNPADYTAIINDAQYQRLIGLLDDASLRGHQAMPLFSQSDLQQSRAQRVLPPTLVLNPDNDSLIMQEEIFGPLLPVKTYQTYEEAIQYITARDRPLALYCFSKSQAEIEAALSRIVAGGVCINDTLYQFACADLPFGGVGASGMGQYHGVEGFRTFSKAMPVLHKYSPASTDLLRPPYGRLADFIIRFLTR